MPPSPRTPARTAPSRESHEALGSLGKVKSTLQSILLVTGNDPSTETRRPHPAPRTPHEPVSRTRDAAGRSQETGLVQPGPPSTWTVELTGRTGLQTAHAPSTPRPAGPLRSSSARCGTRDTQVKRSKRTGHFHTWWSRRIRNDIPEAGVRRVGTEGLRQRPSVICPKPHHPVPFLEQKRQ